MLLRESDADGTMLHDPSAPWSSVDRATPGSTPALLAGRLRPMPFGAVRRSPSRLASVEDRNP